MSEQEATAAGQLLEAVVVEQHFESVMDWVERRTRSRREWRRSPSSTTWRST